jgi:hypothetical protein
MATPALRLTAAEKASLRGLVARLRPEQDALAARLLDAYRTEIPQYAHVADPLVLADMRAVSLAGLRAWFDWIDIDSPVDGDLLGPVLEAIRRRAVQGVGMEAMMRAYRIAVRVVWQEILALPVDQELVGPLSTRMLEFTDRFTTAVEQASAHEARRARRDPDRGRSVFFEAVLAGQPPEGQVPADWLAGPHCVVVMDGSAVAGASPLALDDHVAALVREARAVCWTMRIGSVIAACPVDAEAGGRDGLLRRLARFTHAREPLQVAVGGVAQGPEEIRDSFGEAVEALSVGSRLSGAQGRVLHDYAALAPLATLAAEPDRARRFIREHLQPLGRLAERPWVLPTLSAYLRFQGRLKEVAAELAVHPNTVRYRLNELRGYLDVHAADGDQSAALLLAVHLSELLAAETAQD